MTTPAIIAPKKLIEVALPLDDINKACAKEKSIRHGHPSTLHLWWARRPLAAARAVLFAQLVNDPSWKYTEEELKKNQIKGAITKKRNELFKLITELVQWENTTNEDVLERARKEIRASWKETCEANKSHPEAKTLFDPNKLPGFHDPFAGGGAIPLEAQRLGLESHASDLNPVAVLINRAMIEIPPKFAGRPPVGPVPGAEKQTNAKATEDWSRAKGLAEDVRRYGVWLRDEAERLIGRHFPHYPISPELVSQRPDLKPYVGRKLLPIAWFWARTVASPSPAHSHLAVPLMSSFWLSQKAGAEAWVEAHAEATGCVFNVRLGPPPDPDAVARGTKTARGANFSCLASGAPITPEYIKQEGLAGRMGVQLFAVAADGPRGRIYLPATRELAESALAATPSWRPTQNLPNDPRNFWTVNYGLNRFCDLFTERQLLALSTYADLIRSLRARVTADAEQHGLNHPRAVDYANAVTVYLAFAVNLLLDDLVSLATWRSTHGTGAMGHAFSRQTVPMTWDFPEANPFAGAAGDISNSVDALSRCLEVLPATGVGNSLAMDATAPWLVAPRSRVISTDPPYYDNISYADLSDFFYVWLRRMLADVAPDVFGTILVPKTEELVASPYRHGGKKEADGFFLEGMRSALAHVVTCNAPTTPATIYYAFKQSDTGDAGTASSGWEVFLDAVLTAGLAITATWPLRTERSARAIGRGTNALASSIVLVCRQRHLEAPQIARKEFVRQLERALPAAIAEMIADPDAAVAPVDLAQAVIGPGMAIFSKYKAVLEADGEPMSVHNALVHINKTIDTYFGHADDDLDSDTRFCVEWFNIFGFADGPFGQADGLARAKGTAVDGVTDAGVLSSAKGKVRLLRIKEYPATWDPAKDDRVPVWEACHHMCRALGESEGEAGALLARMPEKQDAIRQLAYRLYTICERQKWAEEARAYNELITSWPAIVEESHKVGHKGTQLDLI